MGTRPAFDQFKHCTPFICFGNGSDLTDEHLPGTLETSVMEPESG
jgi:hypothetical protein